MNKLLINTITLVSMVFLVASCKKDLNQKPHDSILADSAFTSVADIGKGVQGVYSLNSNVNRIYIGSLISDELRLATTNRGQGQTTFKFQYSSTDAEHTSGFAQYYQVLDLLHRVLAGSYSSKVVPGNQDEIDKLQGYRGELYALRANAYYELLIRFMPSGYNPNALAVPIILTSDIFARPPRNTVREVVAQIEKDLDSAANNNFIQDAPDDYHRVSKSAIAAMHARVNLLKRDWNAAYNYAIDALNLSGLSLVASNKFATYWTGDIQGETIWAYRSGGDIIDLWKDSDVLFEASDKLRSQYDPTNDIRFKTYFAGTNIVKYKADVKETKLIRLSEMVLVAAEAAAEMDMLQDGTDALNVLRSVRISGYVPETFATKQELLDAILNERFKELCFEGFRFFDLKRRQLPIERYGSDVQSAEWKYLPPNNFKFALPIPASEMRANSSEVQNPGY